jgi:hypothetical protein
MYLKFRPGGMAKFVVCPLTINDTETVLLVIVVTEFPSEPDALSVMLFVKNEPTVPTKLVGDVKVGADAPDTASTTPSAAPEPMVQRRMMAKVEVAAGFVTKLRTMGSTCSSAARTMACWRTRCFMVCLG